MSPASEYPRRKNALSRFSSAAANDAGISRNAAARATGRAKNMGSSVEDPILTAVAPAPRGRTRARLVPVSRGLGGSKVAGHALVIVLGAHALEESDGL